MKNDKERYRVGSRGSRWSWVCLASMLGACGGDGEAGDPAQSSDGGAGDSGQSTDELTYCDVEPIVDRYCVRCHSDPPQNDAPMALTTWEAIESVRERASDLVAGGFMPFTGLNLTPPVEPLPQEEKALLLEWLDSGAPQGACD